MISSRTRPWASKVMIPLRRTARSTIHQQHAHPFSSKLRDSAEQALEGLHLDGATVAVAGFGPSGLPETLIEALSCTEGARNLTIVSLDVGTDNRGVGKLIKKGKVKRIIAAYVGENQRFAQDYFNGKLLVELTPMGTIAQRLRAAGMGIPAFYSPAGAGTLYGQGGLPLRFKSPSDGNDPNRHEIDLATPPRSIQTFHGKEYLLEHALYPDLSLVKANIADTKGNLCFRGTARNSNPDCAVAAKVTLVEAEHIVKPGDLAPDVVHLPGIYMHGLIQATINEKSIERLRIRNPNQQQNDGGSATSPEGARERIARRAAQEFRDGMYVNLGIGLPTLTANFIPHDVRIELQSENGLLGVGPYPASVEEASGDFINAGKETITTRPGASLFCSSDSFGMIRGGHVNLTILGGLQCSSKGDLASWIVPGKMIKGMGGAMDLVSAPNSRVIVTMEHTTKDGAPRLMEECTYPLTGTRVVDTIITNLGVFTCDKTGNSGVLTVTEIAPGVTIDDIRASTNCEIEVSEDVKICTA